MNKDKLKIYFLELFLLSFLLFTLFESNMGSKIVLAAFLFIYMLVCSFLLKKRKILPIYHKQVFMIMTIFAFIYLAVFYLMGLYFGYYSATVKLSMWSLCNYILPLTIVIISSEVIRHVFLSQKSTKPKFLVFPIMVLIDLIIYTGIYDLTNLDDFLTVIGFIFFASISCNLLYNYISNRYGYKPIVIYRLITVLYVYILPIIPDVYIFFSSILRMIYPYIIYLVFEATYSKKNTTVDFVDRKKNFIKTTLLLIFATLIAMLVSCQFRFGIIVVGSGSMTGEIDKGDAVIFEKYNNHVIKEGQVIIFNKEDLRIIHRVIDIKVINGQTRYFTKGDANAQMDEGFITNKDIYGITNFKIKYIGFPSIWVKDIFS